VHGFSRALLEDYGEKLDETARDYLGRNVQAARDLDRLIQDLLAYSRIATTELPLTCVNLEHIVVDVLGLLRDEIAARGGTVSVARPLPNVIGHAVAERMDFRGPGPIPFLILALAVAFVRGRYAIGLALVLSVVYLGAAFTNPDPTARLANPSDTLGFVPTALHAMFLVMTIVAGIMANMPPQRASIGVRLD
jgi:K+-sensing histidine kinase KdpD